MLTSLSLNLKQFENGKKIPTRVFELLNLFLGFSRHFYGFLEVLNKKFSRDFKGFFKNFFFPRKIEFALFFGW